MPTIVTVAVLLALGGIWLFVLLQIACRGEAAMDEEMEAMGLPPQPRTTIHPIATAPRNGKRIAVGDGSGNVAIAFWHVRAGEDAASGMWAYVVPEGSSLIEQIDFEPTHWSLNPDDFLDDTKTT